MFNYFQKYLILLIYCCLLSFTYPMENEEKQKAINELLNIKKATKTFNSLQEKEWNNALLCLEQNSNNIKNLTLGVFKTPPISFAIRYQQKNLFDYLLKLNTDINVTDEQGNTPVHELIMSFNENPFKEGISLEYLLQNKANIEAKNLSGHTPLYTAIIPRTKPNFIKLLIEYKANIDLENSGKSLLRDAIKRENVTKTHTINTFITACNLGARLTNIDKQGNTIFHLLATTKRYPELVTTIMTYARINKEITKTIKTALLVFNRLSHPLKSEFQEKPIKFPIIPSEIKILILSKLLSPNFFHKGLYATSLNMGYELFSLNLAVNYHIHYLQKILQIKNRDNKTARELLPVNYNRNDTITKMEKLLNEKRTLKNDLEIFNQKFHDISFSITEKNLVYKIFENHYSLAKKPQQTLSKKE